MPANSWIIRNPAAWDSLFTFLRAMDVTKPVEVFWRPAKSKRSTEQNSLSHVWYWQISNTLKEDTPEGVKCECKLRFGVPILIGEDPEFRSFFGAVIRPLTYEQQLKTMRYVPITSRMNTEQLSTYLDHVQIEFAHRGVRLECES